MIGNCAVFHEIVEAVAEVFEIENIKRKGANTVTGEIFLEGIGWARVIFDHDPFRQLVRMEAVSLCHPDLLDDSEYERLDRINAELALSGMFYIACQNGEAHLVYDAQGYVAERNDNAREIFAEYCRLLGEFFNSEALSYAKEFDT